MGKLQNGYVFYNSYNHPKPFCFILGIDKVIDGFAQGISMLSEGSKAVLVIPPHLGYGNVAVGSIPANSTLIYEVEVVKVESAY
ncbi:MAG: FKBP-type peptidyl-prolyl cis-trans isomerase [Bacteroidia bacterium]|nr:FKBP-type peptidyl-prolyl cis-trans isomerase [Bacteroidia bacterium]